MNKPNTNSLKQQAIRLPTPTNKASSPKFPKHSHIISNGGSKKTMHIQEIRPKASTASCPPALPNRDTTHKNACSQTDPGPVPKHKPKAAPQQIGQVTKNQPRFSGGVLSSRWSKRRRCTDPTDNDKQMRLQQLMRTTINLHSPTVCQCTHTSRRGHENNKA